MTTLMSRYLHEQTGLTAGTIAHDNELASNFGHLEGGKVSVRKKSNERRVSSQRGRCSDGEGGGWGGEKGKRDEKGTGAGFGGRRSGKKGGSYCDEREEVSTAVVEKKEKTS